MRTIGIVAVLAGVLAFSAQARADEEGARPRSEVGPIAQATVGAGVRGAHGLAYGGRVGYRMDSGLYLGGAATDYVGEAAPSQLLLGGEVGYDALLGRRWEIRPFAFAGPAIRHGGHPTQGGAATFAVEPGVLAGVRLGRAFLSGEGRVQVTPEPGATSVLGVRVHLVSSAQGGEHGRFRNSSEREGAAARPRHRRRGDAGARRLQAGKAALRACSRSGSSAWCWRGTPRRCRASPSSCGTTSRRRGRSGRRATCSASRRCHARAPCVSP